MKLGSKARELTDTERCTQIGYWRKLQRQASNQDELNEATEQMNILLDELLEKDRQRP